MVQRSAAAPDAARLRNAAEMMAAESARLIVEGTKGADATARLSVSLPAARTARPVGKLAAHMGTVAAEQKSVRYPDPAQSVE